MKVDREGDQQEEEMGDKYENLYTCLQMSKYCQLFYILRIH